MGALNRKAGTMNFKPIFDVVRTIAGPLTQSDVDLINKALIAAQHDDSLVKTGAREIGAAGLALIKQFEGRELTAYKCPADVWTIGYGSTGPHVKPGMTITESEAEQLLRDDLDRFEASVARCVPNATQNEFDAMVSLAFNIGTAGFERSSVLKRLLAGDKAGAADAFLMWNKAGGRVLAGLTRRRQAERELFLS